MTDFESFFQNTDTRFVSFYFANNSEPLLTTYFPSRLSFVSVTSKNIPDVVQTWDEFNEFKSLHLYLHPFFSCRLWQKNSVPRVLCFSSQQQIVLFDWILHCPILEEHLRSGTCSKGWYSVTPSAGLSAQK